MHSIVMRERTLVCFSVQLHLVGLHHLLNSFSDVTQAHVDAGVLQQSSGNASAPDRQDKREVRWFVRVFEPYFDSSIGGVPHSLQQLVVLRVECDGEGTVDDSPCKQTSAHKRTFLKVCRLIGFKMLSGEEMKS